LHALDADAERKNVTMQSLYVESASWLERTASLWAGALQKELLVIPATYLEKLEARWNIAAVITTCGSTDNLAGESIAPITFSDTGLDVDFGFDFNAATGSTKSMVDLGRTQSDTALVPYSP